MRKLGLLMLVVCVGLFLTQYPRLEARRQGEKAAGGASEKDKKADADGKAESQQEGRSRQEGRG